MVIVGYEKRAVELGQKIKAEIRRAGYNQVEFANLLNIQPSRLSNYITGVRVPDIFTLQNIANELGGVSVDYLHSPDKCINNFPKRYLLTVYEGGESPSGGC